MLSISRAKSAKSGMSYFEADSYYAKKNEQGQWFGKNASELGLEGGIERGEFRRILEGCDLEGNKLVRNAMDGRRRSYVDFTFSCPKSVSVLSYTDERIEEAHSFAVMKTLEEIERNYSITREGAGGSKSYRTSNIIAARFNHHESRELDPQLHSHCVVMNMTKGEDGKWRSLEMGQVFKNQLYVGQVYRNELAGQLRKLGYKIDVTDRGKGLFEIAGIDHEIIDQFSTRRRQILKSKRKYEKLNVSDARKAEMACLDSRKYKNDSDIEKIRADTQERLRQYDTSLEELKEEALAAAKILEADAGISARDCISMALEDVTESQSAFRKEEVITLALKNGLGRHSRDEIEAEFARYDGLVELGAKDLLIGRTVAPSVDYFTSTEMVEIETGILRQAEKLDGKYEIRVKPEIVSGILADKERDGIQYSEGQKQAISMMCTSDSFINVVQGDAGSGKTFAVETFREIMNKSDFTVRGFAPTAKAAVELQSAKIETGTVDSFLQSNKESIGRGEVWVVDESGMMGSRKLARFLKMAEEFEAKVVLIGDSKQFQAVEQGKMFADLQRHPGTGYAEITEVRRQKTKHMKEIVSEFKKRNAGAVKDAFEKMSESGRVHHLADRTQRLASVARDYLKDREDGIDSIVLTATNKDRADLNSTIREALLEKGTVSAGFEFETLQNAGISGNRRRFADSYESGQRIFFQREIDGIKRGTEAEIISVEPGNNSISIKMKDPEKGIEIHKTLNLFQAATGIQTFNVQKKKFGVGDSIITLKNDKRLGVENGKIGRIKNIDEQGSAEVVFSRKEIRLRKDIFKAELNKQCFIVTLQSDFREFEKGTECRVYEKNNDKKTISVEITAADGSLKRAKIHARDFKDVRIFEEIGTRLDLKNYPYLDHAYAVTSYKSQGATVEQVRWCHDHTQRTNYNEAYVAITRAKFDATVYTSDPTRLVEHACREQEKESILDWRKIRAKAPERIVEADFDKDAPKAPIQSDEISPKQREATYGFEV